MSFVQNSRISNKCAKHKSSEFESIKILHLLFIYLFKLIKKEMFLTNIKSQIKNILKCTYKSILLFYLFIYEFIIEHLKLYNENNDILTSKKFKGFCFYLFLCPRNENTTAMHTFTFFVPSISHK